MIRRMAKWFLIILFLWLCGFIGTFLYWLFFEARII